jgi:hypothetical protein
MGILDALRSLAQSEVDRNLGPQNTNTWDNEQRMAYEAARKQRERELYEKKSS